MRAVVKKGRPVTTDRRLRDLVLDYIELNAKLEKLGRSGVEANVPPVHATGPIARTVGSIPELDRLLDAWITRTYGQRLKAYHHIFTLPPKDTRGLPADAVARYCMAHTLSAYRAFQAWCRSDADISVAVGYHSDEEHPHDHALVFPRDSKNRPLNFSRLARVKTADGVVRVDFQGFLQRAFSNSATRTLEPDREFDRDPALRHVHPTRGYAEWSYSLFGAFKEAERTGQPVAETFQRFASSPADQLKASDAAVTELAQLKGQFRGEVGGQAAIDIVRMLAKRVTDTRASRNQDLAGMPPPPAAGECDDPIKRLERVRERLDALRKCRLSTETHRLRSLYGIQRAAQIHALVHDMKVHVPVLTQSDTPNLDPLDRLLQRSLIRMHGICEERQPIDLKRDAGVLFSPYEAQKAEKWRVDKGMTSEPSDPDIELAHITIGHAPMPRVELPRLRIKGRETEPTL